jgi:hypothetical protein
MAGTKANTPEETEAALQRSSAAQDGAVRAYIGFSYVKYSRTSFIPFYYTTVRY